MVQRPNTVLGCFSIFGGAPTKDPPHFLFTIQVLWPLVFHTLPLAALALKHSTQQPVHLQLVLLSASEPSHSLFHQTPSFMEDLPQDR